MNKEILNDINVTQTIKEIAETYEEVSVMKIQKIRNSVLTTRDFMLRLSEIFAEVRHSYKKEIDVLRKSKKIKDTTLSYSTLKKPKKFAQVLVTTNEHLVGDIPYKVFTSFLEDLQRDKKGDLIVVGKVGKGLIETVFGPKKEFAYFELPEIGSGIKVIEGLIRLLIQYKDITIYHGKFLNLVNQVQVKSNILEDIEKTAQLNTEGKERKYLFEPSLDKILNFFEIQIFASLFRQSLDEANLANLGSRIRSMEQATDAATERIKVLKVLERRVNKQLENKKQIQRLAGMTLWS